VGVNQRKSKRDSPVRTRNAVSARPFSNAMPCNWVSGSHFSSATTAAGLPLNTSDAKASTQ